MLESTSKAFANFLLCADDAFCSVDDRRSQIQNFAQASLEWATENPKWNFSLTECELIIAGRRFPSNTSEPWALNAPTLSERRSLCADRRWSWNASSSVAVSNVSRLWHSIINVTFFLSPPTTTSIQFQIDTIDTSTRTFCFNRE